MTSTARTTDPQAISDRRALAEAVRLFRAHRRAIGRITLATAVLTVVCSAIGLLVAPRYVAEATVTALPTRTEIAFASRQNPLPASSPAMALSETHREFLLSRTLAERVVTALRNAPSEGEGVGLLTRAARGLAGAVLNVGYRAAALLNYGQWRIPPAKERMIRRLQKSIEVRNIPNSYVMRVAVSWNDPDVAARTANMITGEYVETALAANRHELAAARAFIQDDIAQTLQELQGVDTAIQNYKMNTGVYSGSRDVTLKLEELSSYLQDYNNTLVDLQELNTKIEELEDYQTPTALAADRAERAGLEARKREIERIIEAHSADMQAVPVQENQLRELYRNKTELTANLNTLRQRMLQTRIMEAAAASAVRIIDPATVPLYPEGPRVLFNGIAGLLAGLFLSGAYVAACELGGLRPAASGDPAM